MSFVEWDRVVRAAAPDEQVAVLLQLAKMPSFSKRDVREVEKLIRFSDKGTPELGGTVDELKAAVKMLESQAQEPVLQQHAESMNSLLNHLRVRLNLADFHSTKDVLLDQEDREAAAFIRRTK
jgi:hypothetical protein